MGKRLRKVKSIWTVVNGCRLHARTTAQSIVAIDATGAETGPQPPIFVLIHGLLISSRYMVPTARRLGMSYPVYALDLPGFGRSEHPARVLTIPELADAVIAWMDAMQITQAVLLGNSLGGQVLIDLAARYPARVDRLILIGPTVDPQAPTILQQFSRLLLDGFVETPTLLYHLLVDFFHAGLWQTWQTFQYALQERRIELQKLQTIDAPTLVVRGARDPVAPQHWVEEATRQLSHGELRVIPGSPHCVNYTTPDALVQVVDAFLQKTERTPVSWVETERLRD
ncbi:MAG: alpha/beta hydrolase [Caldilineaceae bacterium]